MKMIITEKEIPMVQGRFVVCVDNYEVDMTINEKNWSFIEEKRLRLICDWRFVGLYYMGHEGKSAADFVNYFNNYTDGKRFHRLLTARELELVFRKMKERNY